MADRTFLFLRHGQTELNLQKRFQGSIDVPLNENGIEQARAAARRLAQLKPSQIVSSPANRVLKTASFVVELTGVPMHIDTDLMELDVGSFEGQDIVALKQAHGLGEHEPFLDILPDDAEKWETFAPRVCKAVTRWVERHPDELTLIVSHGLVFRALTTHLAGEQLSSQNAVPHIFERTSSGWHIREID